MIFFDCKKLSFSDLADISWEIQFHSPLFAINFICTFFSFSVQNLHWKKLNYAFKFPPLFPELYSFSQISETNCEISLNVCTWILENSLRFKENTFSKNSQTISAFNWTQFFTISCSILVFLKVFSTVI